MTDRTGAVTDDLPSEVRSRCDACLHPRSKLRRCTRCYKTAYCDRDCQRRHWRAGHREECRSSAAAAAAASAPAATPDPDRGVTRERAEAAAEELSRILASSSLGDAERDFHLARDEVDRLRRVGEPGGKRVGEEEHGTEDDRSADSRPVAPQCSKPLLLNIDSELKSSTEETKGFAAEVEAKTSCDAAPATASASCTTAAESAVSAAPIRKKSDMFLPPTENISESADSITAASKQQSQPFSPNGHRTAVSRDRPNNLRDKSTASGEGQWVYLAEWLSNISCYSVTIKPLVTNNEKEGDQPIIPSPEYLRLGIEAIGSSQTRIRLTSRAPRKEKESERDVDDDDVLMAATLPGIIRKNDEGIRINSEADCITLRLPYEAESLPAWNAGAGALSCAEDINSVRCRSCGHGLLSQPGRPRRKGEMLGRDIAGADEIAITKVLPLPAGHWDEIIDYLTCYEGQPAVDLTSSSTEAVSGAALEDPSVLVLHGSDLGANVCVLAVDGYGEPSTSSSAEHGTGGDSGEVLSDANLGEANEDRAGDAGVEYRGARPWRDAAGGAAACCASCCSVLGFVGLPMHSADTYRLFKHRLSCACADGTTDPFSRNTCGSFLAAEMVRYAESRAVFTFVVESSDQAEKRGVDGAKCLLLRLLSWDTLSTKGGAGPALTADELNFVRTVKVIFEEADASSLARKAQPTNDPSDPTTWSWGGVDLCCPPPHPKDAEADGGVDRQKHVVGGGNPQAPFAPSSDGASVRIEISPDEWIELREALVTESKLFSKSVRDVTVLMRLGKRGEIQPGGAKLSILPLFD